MRLQSVGYHTYTWEEDSRILYYIHGGAGGRGGMKRSSFEWSPFFILLFLFPFGRLFDRCRMRKEIKRGEEGRKRRRRKKTLNDTWKRKSWYGMRARLPGIRLGCRRYIGLLMTRVSCDSWNVLFCLENMVFLVLVSVSVELGGGYLRIFPLYSEKYNGGIGRWNYCRVRWRSVFRYVID